MTLPNLSLSLFLFWLPKILAAVNATSNCFLHSFLACMSENFISLLQGGWIASGTGDGNLEGFLCLPTEILSDW